MNNEARMKYYFKKLNELVKHTMIGRQLELKTAAED